MSSFFGVHRLITSSISYCSNLRPSEMLATTKTPRLLLLEELKKFTSESLAKRLLRVGNLKKTERVLKNLVLLSELKDKKKIAYLATSYRTSEVNKLANLMQQAATLRNDLRTPFKTRKTFSVRYLAYDKRAYFSAMRLATALDVMGIPYSGPVGLPLRIKKWTLMKSPFKYKKHQETYEQRFYKATVAVDTQLRGELYPNLIKFVEKSAYVGTDVKITTREAIPADQIYVDPYIKEKLSLKPGAAGVDYTDFELDADILQSAQNAPSK